MKIGIDGRSLQDRPWGGVGQYTYGLLRALFELDRENEYVVWYNAFGTSPRTVLNGKKGQSLGDFPTFSEYPNVRVYRTRWPNKMLNASLKVLHRPLIPPLRVRGGEEGLRTAHNSPQPSLTLREGAPDLLLMPNLNFIALPTRTKLILTIHDLSFEHFPEHFSFKSRLWHRAVGPRALLARADHIIAVSEHTKNDLVETYGVDQNKISVIYPGIETRNLKLETRNPISNFQFLISEHYILYFGALEPRKNIEGIIEAFETLTLPPKKGRGSAFNPPLPAGEGRGEGLVIAGLATPYVKHLKQCIARSPARDRIILKENPTEEEKWRLYSGARLFVYPSFYEGFGFPPLEAMAAGVPVVASSAASVPEVCGDAAVLVSPWKVDEIADGMRVLLEDEAVRVRYIEAGRRKAAEFSWEKCAKQILDIFGR